MQEISAEKTGEMVIESIKVVSKEIGIPSGLKELGVKEEDIRTLVKNALKDACVFYSVPEPLVGLKEIRRVLKDDRVLIMLEHVRSKKEPIGTIMDILNPSVARVYGANISRNTADNVKKAEFEIVKGKIAI